MRFLREEVFARELTMEEWKQDVMLQNAFADAHEYYVANIKQRLDSKVIEAYEANDCFHDYKVMKISVQKPTHPNKLSFDVEVQLRKKRIRYNLIYTGVTSIQAKMPEDAADDLSARHLSFWNLCEIILQDDGSYSHEILLRNGATILINFRDVILGG